MIPLSYCPVCDQYIMLKNDAQYIFNIGEPQCSVFTYYQIAHSTDHDFDLNIESPLMIYGYNVNAINNLSSQERQAILKHILDKKILHKTEVLKYLDFFIQLRDGQINYRLACLKWKEDRLFVANYKSDKEEHVGIKSIEETVYL